MSQNDFTLANQSFPSFRADLNSALQALASNNSGDSEPTTTFANMWWYDSANNIMYIRNEDNDAFIKFAELDQTNDKFVLSGTLQLDDGTVSAPALTFNSDTNMGIYRGGTDILKFVTAGTDAITIDASQGVTLAGKLDVSSGTIKLDGNYPVGSNNVALGDNALQDASVGNGNVAIGTNALKNYESGDNTAVGFRSLENTTSGSKNVAVGRESLEANTTGGNNVAIGHQALEENTTASNNTALGNQALTANTTGNSNTAVGAEALDANTVGDRNVAVGVASLSTFNPASNADTYNTAIGYASLKLATTSTNNTAVGGIALTANTTGTLNTAVGKSALQSNTTASDNTAVGGGAMEDNTTGASNTAVGRTALGSNTTASNNTAVGYQAGYSNTTGGIVAIGHQSGMDATTAIGNVFVGELSGTNITTGNNNTAVGSQALSTATTATDNVAVGHDALRNNTGNENTAVGYNALTTNTTGYQNVAVGRTALNANTTGFSNTAIGQGAGRDVTTGTKNTIIGRYSGNQGGLDIRTSSNYIVLSDGDGNPRVYYDPTARSNTGGLTSENASADMTASTSGTGFAFGIDGFHEFQRSGSVVARFGRLTNDGNLIEFTQAGVQEGTISVSGSTVSYNGGHLSRWSRLLDNNKDASIIKGTVMTNLNEMVEWGDEDNEQLNKMAVSSVEGDVNVAGVFVNWDNDDDWNDMNIAMTGDMVIRIAQGTTVARGDLLMSAGDGTAKPQGDDIVRSKTIAKVTSTNVSHTYDDGTYLVPCVLMAC